MRNTNRSPFSGQLQNTPRLPFARRFAIGGQCVCRCSLPAGWRQAADKADGRKPPAVIRTEGARAAKAAAAALTGALARRLPPGGSIGRGGGFPLCIPGPPVFPACKASSISLACNARSHVPPSPVALSGQLSAGTCRIPRGTRVRIRCGGEVKSCVPRTQVSCAHTFQPRCQRQPQHLNRVPPHSASQGRC